MQTVNKMYVGDGNVVLLAGGGKIFTDTAAKFCRSEKELADIIGSPYNKKIVENIVSSNHQAALEFDQFIFGVEGYARVTEVQLVRKRLASYLIKSGRVDKHGKRSFDVVVPKDIETFSCLHTVSGNHFADGISRKIALDSDLLLELLCAWYSAGVDAGIPEEDLRYMKPQATEFKAIIRMDAASLLNWFCIRTCNRAQTEIRDMATKMMGLCREAAPDLFINAGPSCVRYGYCTESEQCDKFRGIIPKKENAMETIKSLSREALLASDLTVDDVLELLFPKDHRPGVVDPIEGGN